MPNQQGRRRNELLATVEAFWTFLLGADTEVQYACEDRIRFAAVYRAWKDAQEAPEPQSPVCGECVEPSPSPSHATLSDAQVLGDLSDRFPRDLDFGIELELTVSDTVDRETLGAALRAQGLACAVFERIPRSTDPEDGVWKIMPDSSIACTAGQSCNTFELVSPKLRGPDALPQVLYALTALRRFPLSVNKSAGFHVHVSVEDLTLTQIKQVCAHFITYEEAFDAIVPPSRRSNIYCASNRFNDELASLPIKAARAKIASCTTAQELCAVMNPRGSRYHKLNLQNLASGRQPTLEFRQHSATSAFPKVACWLRLCLSFVHATAQSRTAPHDQDSTSAAVKLAHLLEWFIKEPALHAFFTRRMRQLTAPPGNAACCSGCNMRATTAPAAPSRRVRGSASEVLYWLVKQQKVSLRGHVVTLQLPAPPSGSLRGQQLRVRASAQRVLADRTRTEQDKGGMHVEALPALPGAVPRGAVWAAPPMRVVNLSPSVTHVLRAVKVLARGDVFSATCNQDLPISLPPGGTASVMVAFSPRCLGAYQTLVSIEFNGFAIGRYVTARCGDAAVAEALKPTAPYARQRRSAMRTPRTKQEYVDGEPPPQAQMLPYARALAGYAVPRNFQATYFRTENDGGGDGAEGLEEGAGDDAGSEGGSLQSDATAGASRGSLSDHLQAARARLSKHNYTDYFRKLLWCEEIQMGVDIKSFDMQGVPLTPRSQGYYLALAVPGLAESRPSVVRGDKVFVTSPSLPGRTFAGYCHSIELETALLKFHADFHRAYLPGMLVDVRFTFTRTVMRLQQQGLAGAHMLAPDLLFPERGFRLRPPLADAQQLGALRDLNAAQAQAVHAIVQAKCRPLPYLIFGPPGTGKTMTMVAAIAACLRLDAGAGGASRGGRQAILVAAPSNSAADLLCERLHRLWGVTPHRMLRIMAYSRERSTWPEGVVAFSKVTGSLALEAILQSDVVVTTLNLAASLYNHGVPRGHFHRVFVDEAGQGTEPEVMAAVGTLLASAGGEEPGQLVLAGDPKQLGPIILSPVAKACGLEVSALERLMARPLYHRDPLAKEGEPLYDGTVMTKLVENYRSHAGILALPNRLFYDGDLRESADPRVTGSLAQWEHLPRAGLPLVFHSLQGQDEREAASPSWFNRDECAQVLEYVRLLVHDTARAVPVRAEEIMVITPYHKQVLKLNLLLGQHGFGKVKVGSVEKMQGQEARVVIISTVRSSREFLTHDRRHALGFVGNAKRFNVAITRAQALLIVVGNAPTLASDPHWKAFMTHCAERGAWSGEAAPAEVAPRGPAPAAGPPAESLEGLSEMLAALELLHAPAPAPAPADEEYTFVQADAEDDDYVDVGAPSQQAEQESPSWRGHMEL